MSDTNTTPNDKTVAAATTVLADVADRVKTSAPLVRANLVERLVNQELTSRVEKLDKALQQRTTLQRDFFKANKPDTETYNADGSVASASYSKTRLEEVKKAREALEKMDNAIEKALTGDFQKLNEVSK